MSMSPAPKLDPVFKQLLDELAPEGIQTAEVQAMPDKALLTLIADRAKEELKRRDQPMQAVDFFVDAAKCMRTLRGLPVQPEPTTH